ncbi:hypothetical protein NHP190003_15310 [Helicobacter sp. NHP19-003]|uniref:Uncharacterized protein n=1 Tax=Helicobacter gastrocanis TaxID=2849641 RepID=A0ABN6I3V5_9HELI|nr:hypothetical protein [Helicobacter sp. NHP19-003]BCZ18249.1 hypothetical protein NHP190003_15310 [Helicobacter sp. NHP19-003]
MGIKGRPVKSGVGDFKNIVRAARGVKICAIKISRVGGDVDVLGFCKMAVVFKSGFVVGGDVDIGSGVKVCAAEGVGVAGVDVDIACGVKVCVVEIAATAGLDGNCPGVVEGRIGESGGVGGNAYGLVVAKISPAKTAIATRGDVDILVLAKVATAESGAVGIDIDRLAVVKMGVGGA